MKRFLLLFCTAICIAQTMLALSIEEGKYYTISNRNDVNLYVKDAGVDIIQMEHSTMRAIGSLSQREIPVVIM